VLGVSVSALESLLVRARKALRAELERHRAAMTD
jgi:DNA-directed RNA polymerase specialized sigma24 family protein